MSTRYIPLLDVGNVLVTVNMSAVYHEALRLGLAKSEYEAKKLLDYCDSFLNLGMMDMETFLFGHFNSVHLSGGELVSSLRAFKDFWVDGNWISLNTEILDYLLDNVYQFDDIALVSNIGFDHYKVIHEMHPFFKHEHVSWFASCEVGAQKPSKIYYDLLMRGADEEATYLFVDDREINLKAAQIRLCHKFDVQTFQFNSATDDHRLLIDELEDMITEQKSIF